MRRPRRQTLRLLASLAVLVAALVFAWWYALRDTSTPVTVTEALSLYRADGSRGRSAPRGPAAPGPVGVPVAGVYAFATTGSEVLRGTPLGDTSHDYPRETALVVRSTDCGFREQWVPLADRARELSLCRTDRGWQLDRARETRAFFGIDMPRELDCPASVLAVPLASPAPRRWTTTCAATGISQMTITTRSRVVGRERLEVAGRAISTVHVQDALRFSGETRGTATRDSWRRVRDGMLVRQSYREQTVAATHVGDVGLTDRYDLRLVSPTPRR